MDGILFNKDKTVLLMAPAGFEGDVYRIPDGVKSLYSNAFSECGRLKKIIIPDSITRVTDIQYSGGENITQFEISGRHPAFSIHEGVLLNKARSQVLLAPDGIEHYEIPEGVADIPWFAFRGCAKLRRVVIPESVRTLESGTFSSCTGLKEVVFLGDAPFIRGDAFMKFTKDITMLYDPEKEGWDTPEWQGYPAYPKN